MNSDWDLILKSVRNGNLDEERLAKIVSLVQTSEVDCEITFGTSGWRAELGEEYSMYNVQKVTRAIVDMYENHLEGLEAATGVNSFTEFQQKGVLLGHDTRLMGKEFAESVASVLQEKNIRTAYAGVATTPEFSAAVPSTGFACSINLTPSHNPGNYGGYKFNPADGGPAGPEITRLIEKCLKELPRTRVLSPTKINWQPYDILSAYTDFVERHDFLDLKFCREFAHSGKISLAHDAVYGATKGRPGAILNKPKALKEFRIEDEPLFKGAGPEPSVENMQAMSDYLDTCETPFKLGAIMDPDGDRVRFYDGEGNISMNQFGAIAFHYIVQSKEKAGGVAKSVATSNFINAVAKKLNRPLYETAVGFKNFRNYLKAGTSTPALVCFEESDGISGFSNTLEKDAQIGFLLAIEIMGKTQKSLSGYLKMLQSEVGTFYPQRHGFALPGGGVSVPSIMAKLKSKYPQGTIVNVQGTEKEVQDVITLDGLKIVFTDESWMLIRPSGTEPKVRVYTESQNEEDSKALFEVAKEMFFSEV